MPIFNSAIFIFINIHKSIIIINIYFTRLHSKQYLIYIGEEGEWRGEERMRGGDEDRRGEEERRIGEEERRIGEEERRR